MGNYKFRLTDMIPNAWLYKLKDMRRKGSRKQSVTSSKRRSLKYSPRPSPSPKAAHKLVPNRASYYISSRKDSEKWYAPSLIAGHCKPSDDAQLILDTPRRSKKMTRSKPITRASAATATADGGGCRCRTWKTKSIREFGLPASPESPSCQRDYYIEGEAPPPVLHKTNAFHSISCEINRSPSDIIIDISTNKSLEKPKEFTVPESEIELSPILTKLTKKVAEPVKFENKDVDPKAKSHNVSATPVKSRERSSASSPAGPYRFRMRANSPRLASKKALQSPRCARKSAASAPSTAAAMQDRKGFSGSFAVVKSSSDPQRDFRDSMLDMIVELDMRTSKDLEDLLICYLLLNSGEYHDVIVKAFQQVWFDLTYVI